MTLHGMQDDAMDEVDKAFLDSFRKDGMTPTGFIAVIQGLGPEGQMQARVYSQLDAPLSTCLGMLDMAKIYLYKRCEVLLDGDMIDLDGSDDDADED